MSYGKLKCQYSLKQPTDANDAFITKLHKTPFLHFVWLKLKTIIYNSMVKSVLIYGAETWSLYEDDRMRINGTEMDALNFKRRIKSHLPFAGIIRSTPYSPRQRDKGSIEIVQQV